MFQHILVPTDGSQLSWGTAMKALEFAKAIQARVTFFHALPATPTTFFGGEGTLTEQELPEEIEAEANAQATILLGKLCEAANKVGVNAASATAKGLPFEGIIATAKDRNCDLILMASHGYRGIKGMILGSETQKVLTHSTIPVLVYR